MCSLGRGNRRRPNLPDREKEEEQGLRRLAQIFGAVATSQKAARIPICENLRNLCSTPFMLLRRSV
jgi:hypothetical protein